MRIHLDPLGSIWFLFLTEAYQMTIGTWESHLNFTTFFGLKPPHWKALKSDECGRFKETAGLRGVHEDHDMTHSLSQEVEHLKHVQMINHEKYMDQMTMI